MKGFLFRAIAPDGSKIHDRVEASTLDQARYILEIRHYRDIEFLDSENQADIRRMIRARSGLPEDDPPHWTPEDDAQSRQRRGLPRKLWWAFKEHWVFIGPLVVWNLWSCAGPRPFTLWDWAGFGASTLYFLWFVRLVTPMILWQLILEACIWHEWPAARRRIRLARWLRKFIVTAIPATELDIREATALAAMGRLAEGLQLLEPYKNDPEVPEYLLLGRLAGVYEKAGQYERAVELTEEAARKNPSVTAWIDVANALVKHRRDVAGARAALEKLGDREIPAIAKAVRLLAEGQIHLAEGDDRHAAEYFAAGVEKIRGTGGSALIVIFIAEARAGQAIALGRLGRKEEARRLLAPERPLLEARQETELLARCAAALA